MTVPEWMLPYYIDVARYILAKASDDLASGGITGGAPSAGLRVPPRRIEAAPISR